MQCTLCNSSTVIFCEYKEKLFYKCSNCEGILLNKDHYLDFDTEKHRYDKHSDDIEDKGYQEFVKPLIDIVLENHTFSDKGLDYGCGKTAIVEQLLLRKQYNMIGYDPIYFPEENILKGKYNYITSCEVVEHFYNPAKEFQRLSELLLPTGKLYLKTYLFKEGIEFKNWWYKNDPTHVFFYSARTFEYIKEEFKFSNLQINDKYIELSK